MISSKLYIQLERYLHIISPERKKTLEKKLKKIKCFDIRAIVIPRGTMEKKKK
jgi:hypothetical protein